MKKIITTTLLTVVCVLAAMAQNGTIKGRITMASSGESVPGATVVEQVSKAGAAADLDGNYTLSLPAGTYSLVYKTIGPDPVIKTVTVTAGATVTQDVAFYEKGIDITGIEVFSEGKFAKDAKRLVSTIDVIKPSMVENKGTTSMDQAMQQAPGVAIVNGEAQIRGGSGYSFGAGSRVMVMIDDLPMLSGDAGRPSWGIFPVENIEQIEVSKGASSVLYGSGALNGVINIRTSYPKAQPITKVTIQTGLYDRPQNRAAIYWGNDFRGFSNINFLHSRQLGKQKNIDLVVGGNYFKDNGFKGRELPDTTTVDQYGNITPKIKVTNADTVTSLRDPRTSSFEQRGRVNFSFRYRNKKLLGLNYGINGNLQYSESAGNLLWLNSKEGMYTSYAGSSTLTLQTTYNFDPFLNYSNDNGSTHRVRTRVFSQNNNNDNNQANKFTLGYGEYQYSKRFHAGDTSRGGFGNILLRFLAEEAIVTGGVMGTYTRGEAALYKGNENGSGISNAMNVAAYAQYENRFMDRFTYILGARYEYFKINGSTDGKPVVRAGFNYKLSTKGIFRETYIRGSFGQGFRFPTIAEKYIRTQVGPLGIFPNLDIKPETAWNAEIGIKQGFYIGNKRNPDKAFKGYIDVAYFHQRFFNTIEFTFGKWGNDPVLTKAIGFKSFNIGNTEVTGVDISIMGTGKIGNVTVNALMGYTYMNPKTLNPDKVILVDPVTAALLGAPSANITYRDLSSDPTNNRLKYRFQHLVKADLEFEYKWFLIGASVRYNSFMQNVDKVFEALDGYGLNTGVKQYRKDHNKGDYVVDMRLGFNIASHSRLSFLVQNLLNREYMLRPLDIMPPRTFAIQYQLKF